MHRPSIVATVVMACLVTPFSSGADPVQSGSPLIDSATVKGQSEFPIVAVKCPETSEGAVEFDRQDFKGDRQRVRLTYRTDAPNAVTIMGADHGKPLKTLRTINLRTESDEDLREMAKIYAKQADEIRTKICLGSAGEKMRYLEIVKSNAAKVGGTASTR